MRLTFQAFLRRFLAAMVCCCATTLSSAVITIVNGDSANEGFNDPTPAAPVGGNNGTTIGQQRLVVFQRAAEIWGRVLVSAVPIRVAARFDPLYCTANEAVLGSAGPVTAIRDFAGAPRAGTYYVIALANAYAGQDLDPDDDDIEATFNSDLGQADCLAGSSWYYGLDGNTPQNAINLLDTILHEFGHGLGFVSFANLTTGARLNGFNDAYINNLEDHTTGKTYPQMTDTERRNANVATGDLHWVGTNVLARSGILSAGRGSGGHVEMYAPNPVESGSSVSHFSNRLLPDELMEPFATATVDMRLTLELLRDVGWTVVSEGPSIVADAAVLASESCAPFNGVIDPGENVSVSIPLRNIGMGATTNLVATLLPSGGVSGPGAPQSFGSLLPNGPAVARTFSFVANSSCGSTLDATLQLQDGTNGLGTVSVRLSVGRTLSFTNATPISVPLSGLGIPFPSTVAVAGLNGTVGNVSVRLANVSHSNPDDLDVLLVGPNGQSVLLMSDAGGSGDISGANLTFDDSASAGIADSSQIVSGTFRPTNFDSADALPAPAPAGNYGATLSSLLSGGANGVWMLYVFDDDHPRSGSIAGGWSLKFQLCCAGQSNTPPTLALASAPLTYIENSGPTIIDASTTVADTDSPDFNGGQLTVAIVTNGTPEDRLFVRHQGNSAGQIAVAGSNITFGGTPLATSSGGSPGTTPLSVNFTSGATLTAVQALLRNVSFTNVSENPSGASRAVRFTISDGDGGTSAPVTKSVNVVAVNDPPILQQIPDRIVDEGSPVIITNIATDPETAPGGLTFAVLSAVSGISMNPTNGVLVWTPGEAQGPSTNAIRVTVRDGGTPTLSVTQNFTVVVLEVNEVPALVPIPNRVVHAGTLVALTNSATDPDLPLNTMSYAVSNVPAGATFDAATGVFTWLPGNADANTTNRLLVTVTDNGLPPATDSRSFSIMVLSPPAIESITSSGGEVMVDWSAIPGTRYRLQFKTALDDSTWIDVAGDVIAAGTAASKLHAQELDQQRFYRVQVLP